MRFVPGAMRFVRCVDACACIFHNVCRIAGTGKTMIGVALARALLADPACTILLLTYTNHALDQFCESLIASGLSKDQVLRALRLRMFAVGP